MAEVNSPKVTNRKKENQKSTDIPFIEIIEQPDSVRYRYVCEGRTAGSILGVNSSNDSKTYPTIKINGYKGKVLIIVSCVTKDKPYRPHPCRLVGGDHCKNGIYKAEINDESMTLSLKHVGVQCVKRSNVDEALKERESRRIDPFKTGFSHRDIDYNVVKLCFQAIIIGSQPGQLYQLEPVVSDNVPDKKMMTGLMIYRLSHASAPITGNTEIILLCDKVMKDDIEIRFFETKNGKRIWECLADFNPLDVHKQMAICFRTPTYYLKKIENPVHVKIQLRRPSDGKCGECYPFILTPNFSDFKNRKRSRISSDGFKHLLHNPVHVSQLPIPNNTEALMNVSYNTSESIMENIETIPKTSGVFCPPLSSNAYNPLSSGFEWTPPLQSTYQLTKENSNMLCGQAEVNVQTPTAVLVYVDQLPNYSEILTTNQYDTSESKSIKKILEIGSVSNNVMQSPSNTSVYIQPSPTYSPIETQFSDENPNTMYGQADIHFQPNIDFPTYSPNASTASPTLLSTSSKMADVLDFLTCTTENAHSTNSMEISTSELCNIDPYDLLIDDVENLSANLSASLSI